MAAIIDYRAVFALQRQIIKSPNLTDSQKLQMISDAIDEAIGDTN